MHDPLIVAMIEFFWLRPVGENVSNFHVKRNSLNEARICDIYVDLHCASLINKTESCILIDLSDCDILESNEFIHTNNATTQMKNKRKSYGNWLMGLQIKALKVIG